MTTSTNSQMPMGQAALKATGPSTILPPLPPPPKGGMPMPLPPPPMPAAPPVSAAPALPPLAPPGAPAAPPAPAGVPWNVKLQPDGSSVYFVPSPDGNSSNDLVLGVNQAPKLPKALHQPQHKPMGQ